MNKKKKKKKKSVNISFNMIKETKHFTHKFWAGVSETGLTRQEIIIEKVCYKKKFLFSFFFSPM